MDPLAGFLDGPRARRAFLLRSLLLPPWSLRIEDGSPLTLIAIVRGRGCIVPDEAGPVWLEEGSIAVINGTIPYLVADAPETPPQVVVHPGNVCSAPDGGPVEGITVLGARTWGSTSN